MKIVPNKKYMTRGRGEITLLADFTNPITGIEYDEYGVCGCKFPDCKWDIVSEVVKDLTTSQDSVKIFNSGIKFGPPLAPEDGIFYKNTVSKQNLFELTLDIPQDTMTFVLTKKVEVNGISYLAKIELEKV